MKSHLNPPKPDKKSLFKRWWRFQKVPHKGTVTDRPMIEESVNAIGRMLAEAGNHEAEPWYVRLYREYKEKRGVKAFLGSQEVEVIGDIGFFSDLRMKDGKILRASTDLLTGAPSQAHDTDIATELSNAFDPDEWLQKMKASHEEVPAPTMTRAKPKDSR